MTRAELDVIARDLYALRVEVDRVLGVVLQRLADDTDDIERGRRERDIVRSTTRAT